MALINFCFARPDIDNILNRYSKIVQKKKTIPKKTLTKTPEKILTSPQKNSTNSFNPNGLDISDTLLKNYKFTWTKPSNIRVAKVDYDFLMIFHPEMQFFIPHLNAFVKGATPNKNPEKIKFYINEKIKKAQNTTDNKKKIKQIEIKLKKVENKLSDLFMDKNLQYQLAYKNTKPAQHSRPEGPMPENIDTSFKYQKDYVEMIGAIDKNFKIKQKKLEQDIIILKNKLKKEKMALLNNIYTSEEETSKKFIAISADIDKILKQYIQKAGYDTVFNISFDRSYFFDLAQKNNFQLNFDEYKNTLYTDFLDKSKKIKTYDNGLPSGYINELRNWYYSNQKVKDALSALRSNTFVIAGGQDITSHIIYLVFRGYNIAPERAEFIIDAYNRILNNRKKLLNIHSQENN